MSKYHIMDAQTGLFYHKGGILSNKPPKLYSSINKIKTSLKQQCRWHFYFDHWVEKYKTVEAPFVVFYGDHLKDCFIFEEGNSSPIESVWDYLNLRLSGAINDCNETIDAINNNPNTKVKIVDGPVRVIRCKSFENKWNDSMSWVIVTYHDGTIEKMFERHY